MFRRIDHAADRILVQQPRSLRLPERGNDVALEDAVSRLGASLQHLVDLCQRLGIPLVPVQEKRQVEPCRRPVRGLPIHRFRTGKISQFLQVDPPQVEQVVGWAIMLHRAGNVVQRPLALADARRIARHLLERAAQLGFGDAAAAHQFFGLEQAATGDLTLVGVRQWRVESLLEIGLPVILACAATKSQRHVIDGYGDRYLVPTFSLLDELGEAYGFDDAGRALSAARELTRSLIASGRAADCSYAEANRRATALRFVLDAFNGKVDTVLAKVKAENAGTLGQQIRDAFALVNLNGKAFRDARITPEYLNARLAELKAAASVQALREREREEQRRIREQIREEEKARREIERALKEAAKEEEALQRALDKVRLQVAKASDEQRAAFEAKLAELQGKLSEAESRNRRALSMAQQTKAGHVYVISNVGSFGENVLKVGMTRRLEPQDRIRELGDASVPFEFDVHAMLWTEDAPALERELHRRFVRSQVNKVNPRKEFFRVSVAELKTCVDGLGLETTWTVTAAAAQYRETLAIERALKEGAAIAQHWIRDQMAFEPELDGVTNDTMTATDAPA